MGKRKAMAVLLALALVFSMITLVSADSKLIGKGFADTQSSKQADAIAYLRAFGVLRGDAGTNNYRPDDALTREEFVTIVARATGYEELASGLSGLKPSYKDAESISSWARGAVNLATGEGWLRGYPDGTFRPQNSLTMAEAITVLVRVTGHELTLPPTSLWPIGHLTKANAVGISTGVGINANAPITRQDMARLTYNMLFVGTVGLNAEGKLIHGDSIGSLWTVTGVVADIDTDDERIVINTGDPLDPADNVEYVLSEQVTLIGGNTLDGLQSLTVRATVNLDNEVYILEILKGGVAAMQLLAQKKDVTVNGGTMVLQDGFSFKVNADTVASINGVPAAGAGGTIGNGNVKAFFDEVRIGSEVQASVIGGVATQLLVISLNHDDYVISEAPGAADASGHRQMKVKLRGDGPEYELSVWGTARIEVNGERASVTDLKVNDVVQLATDNFIGVADGDWVSKVSATRHVVAGKVTDKIAKLTGAGPTYETTLTVKQADGTSVSVRWWEPQASAPDALNAGPAIDDFTQLLLNVDGIAVHDRGDVPLTGRLAKVVAIWNDGTGDHVDLNIFGTIHSYRTAGLLAAADLGTVGVVSHDSNEILSYDVVTDWSADAEIVSIIDDNIIIYKIGNLTGVAAAPAVFAWLEDNEVGDYLGVSALKVGDTIRVSEAPGSATGRFVLKK